MEVWGWEDTSNSVLNRTNMDMRRAESEGNQKMKFQSRVWGTDQIWWTKIAGNLTQSR